MELFREVAHEHGTGVIVVTHDHRALDVFDTVYHMEDGVLGPATLAGIEAGRGTPANGVALQGLGSRRLARAWTPGAWDLRAPRLVYR